MPYAGFVQQSPPDDPEAWSDDEWLAWLSETDSAEVDGPAVNAVQPVRDRLPTSGRLLYAGMHGLHQVIYGQVEQPAIVIEASGGEPDDPETVEVHLDTEHPEDSTVTVRSWLLEGDQEHPSA